MQLSETAYYFLGGLMKHAYNYTAIMNPTVNSYKRLVPGYEAPVTLHGLDATVHHLSAFLHHVVWEPVWNFVLLTQLLTHILHLLSCLKQVLTVLKTKIEAPAPVESNIYVMTEGERKEAGIRDLPSTLHNAVKALQEDEVVKAALGEHIFVNFVEAKEKLNGQAMRPLFRNGKLITI